MEITISERVYNQLWSDKRTFNPLPVEKGLGRMTLSRVRFNFPPMNALQVKGLVDVLIVEQILHDEEVSFRLNDPCLQVPDLDSVKSDQFG